ncbi:cytochrome c oxidase assembly protein [Ectothiorhodospiraceae bacterium 2226]|nr:cytochrome c oxidase assembly protein [Ectothiorhodospiraceae bacterium 2226]
MKSEVQKANRRMLGPLVLVVLGMFGFGFALVPLYQVFCDITGFDGRTGRIAADAEYTAVDTDRWVTVEFVGLVNGELPWDLRPEVTRMQVRPGELISTNYVVTNRAPEPTVGQAVPNVAPNVWSRFFNKTECFCFTQQTLEAGEQRTMPVRFVVDPRLPQDAVQLTLSYTFFEAGAKPRQRDEDRMAKGRRQASTEVLN